MIKGSKMTTEQKEKLSLAHQGQVAWNKGKPRTWESSGSFKKGDERLIGNKYGFQKGVEVWNKGTKGICKPNKTSFKKGQIGIRLGAKASEETKLKQSISKKGKNNLSTTKFKKGKPSWNKGIHTNVFGDKHPNWKGGVTTENRKARTSLEMKLWRDAVFARDGYTCQKTGQVGGKLRCHHILNFSTYIELRFAIDNGVTLSDESHKEFHRRYGIKNNTREQLQEYLNSN